MGYLSDSKMNKDRVYWFWKRGIYWKIPIYAFTLL